jgi:ubiquitin carboxyl-terminal hydrolase MINDY-1/2
MIQEPQPEAQPVPQPALDVPPISQEQFQASVENFQSSISDVWYLKNIEFGEGNSRKNLKIITQNFNGPCSFIAICNILILRGAIEILPPSRVTVSYEFLSQLLAEHLLITCPEVDITAALEIMPCTRTGMDLNPVFTGAKSFRPHGLGGELKLFEQVGIDLVHGWLVDPESPEAGAVSRTQDYDSSVMLIAEVDHITKGRFVLDDSDAPQAGSSKSPVFSDEERTKIEDATTATSIRHFLDVTKSQLTYHGLFYLASTTSQGALVALFRNLHLSVLYKCDTSLYSLVTDQVFFNEPSIVWERIEGVDGGSSMFVGSFFM